MSTLVAQIILNNKKQIVQDWVELIRSIPNSKYKERPLSELLASGDEGVLASVEFIGEQRNERLQNYINNVSLVRLQMGFEIAEVTEALLAFREAVFPYIFTALKDQPQELIQAISNIDKNVRWAISKFSETYAQGLNRQLQKNLQELHEHEAKMHQQKQKLERNFKEITSLMKSVRTIASALDLDIVLNYIIEQATDLMGTENCVILEMDEFTQDLVMRTHHGKLVQSAASEIITLFTEEQFIQQVILSRQLFQISDVAQEPRLAGSSIQNAFKKENVRAILATPLVSQEKVLGVIAVLYEQPHDFSEDELNLLMTFSSHAAIAINNARLYEKSRQAAILEERNRLAREIHDNLAQGLTAIVLQMEVVDRMFSKNPEQIKPELENIKQQARKNLQEARRSVWDLRAGTHIMLPLHERIKKAIDKFQIEDELGINFQLEGSPVTISAEATNHIFRIFQESMNNVFQHAQAKNVWIKLRYYEKSVALTVTDDGIGLKSYAGKSMDVRKGFGLMGMQERARILKGTLDIEGSVEKGTTVALKVPLANWTN